jgi:type II secretory pathway component PulF
MPVFAYNAIDLDASELTGTIVADTPRQARDLLRKRGFTITRIDKTRQANHLFSLRKQSGRQAESQVCAFIRELSVLLQAAIPLLSALETLSRQHRGRFRSVIQDIADQVAGGSGLAEAMKRHNTYFDTMSLSIIAVGENTGSLDHALERLADFKEKGQRLKSRVATALLYPIIVLCIGVIVCLFLMTYVVPNLIDSLSQTGRELPTLTQFVKTLSDFLVSWWWGLLLVSVGLAIALRMLLQTNRGSIWRDRFVLHVPFLGELIRKENTSRMAVVLEALLCSGLDFIEAVSMTRCTLTNRTFRHALKEYERAVAAGEDVAIALESSGVFKPLVVQMLAVGQKSGDLEDMLHRLADTYTREVNTATQRLTAVLEPLLIVLLAIVVGFIVFATILPIMEISNVL